MKENKQVVIIGGGLSGLTLAYLLQHENVNVTVLEASSRLGGRIFTGKGLQDTPLELGATWFSNLHPHLQALMEELGLQKFQQYTKGISIFQTKSFEPAQYFEVPASTEPSYRISGGTGMLIKALESGSGVSRICYDMRVTTIEQTGDSLLVRTANGQNIEADIVVSCIPPQLLSAQITFSPELPASVKELLPAVQTWMAGAVKFVIEYKSPFWRRKGFSGMVYSHAGMITEMYDHTNAEEDRFGFTGFLNPGTASYAKAVRQEYVLNQLASLMGEEALDFSLYEDNVWTSDYLLAGNTVFQRPHQNNGHPLLHDAYLKGRFYFCGTETATQHAGYMEGAVIAAKDVAQKIIDQLKV